MTLVIRPLTRWYLKLRHQVFGRRHRRLVLEQVSGVPLLVLPDVFNPGLFRTSAFLVDVLRRSYPGQSAAGQSALDMGTGAGLAAIAAAGLGMRVVGVDISPEAVRCARINVLLNRVESQVDVRQGDLFAPLDGEQFDLVLFNPPFWRGTPANWHDHAWRGADVFERFAAGLAGRLRLGGQALIVLSTDGDAPGMLAALRANGHVPRPAASRNLGNETLTVYAVPGAA